MVWSVDLQLLCPCVVQGSFCWEREEGIKEPTFIFTDCSRHFQVITGLILQWPHTAVTLISSWDIWGNWGADRKDLAEGTHVVKGGIRLAFQDWSCCEVFGDRIKLIWELWGQSSASGIQNGKLGTWEVKGPDEWVLSLEDPWESNKPISCFLQNPWVVPLSLSLPYTLTEIYTYPQTWFPQAVIS